jgi:hypothetical protein
MATIGKDTERLVMAEAVLRECVAALRKVAGYRLPPALDERLLWLSEHKSDLSQAERGELAALVELAEERSVDKLQAQAALQRIGAGWPQLVNGVP